MLQKKKNKNHTRDIVECPASVKPIGCKWIYSIKLGVSKHRLGESSWVSFIFWGLLLFPSSSSFPLSPFFLHHHLLTPPPPPSCLTYLTQTQPKNSSSQTPKKKKPSVTNPNPKPNSPSTQTLTPSHENISRVSPCCRNLFKQEDED